MTEEPRIKVLVSAYACAPHRGSEPGVGWNWSLQAAKEHEVWVLTWSFFRQAIEAELAINPQPHLHFVYYDMPRWVRRLPLSERQTYALWQFLVYPTARRLHRKVGFDLVHHLNQATLEMPGLLWRLDAPFVWGPAGGGQVPPKSLKSYYRGLWGVEVLRALRKRFLRFNPLVRMAARRARRVIASNPDTARLLEPLVSRPLLVESESAVTLPPEPAPLPAGKFTISWYAVLMPRKGPLLALDVAEELKRRGVDFDLRMGGEGQWADLLAQEVKTRDLGGRVSLLGSVPFEQMGRFYEDSHAFLFTSLQDTTGMVNIEAMAHGRPVVCLDHQGASVVVTKDTGIKVPVGAKEDVVRGLADALQRLAGDRELARSLGTAARQRVIDRYTWDHKAEVIREAYGLPSARHLSRAYEAAEPEAVGASRGGVVAGLRDRYHSFMIAGAALHSLAELPLVG